MAKISHSIARLFSVLLVIALPFGAAGIRDACAATVTGTKTVDSGTALPGASITYSIVLSNSGGTAQADNPGNEFLDVLPSGLTLDSASATSGTAVATLGTNTVTWNGNIPSGGSVTITISATINSGTAGQTISNQGTIFYDADANDTNESTALTDDPGVGGATDPTSFDVVCTNLSIAVSAPGDSGAGTLRQAIADACPSGATITFSDNLTISLASELAIGKSLTIDATGHTVTVSGGDTTRVFSVNAGASLKLQNLTVAGGAAAGSSGGGILNDGGSVILEGCTLRDNSAGTSGGAVYSSGTLSVTNSTFYGNSAVKFGGAVFAQGTLALAGSTIAGNSANDGGGGLHNSAAATVSNSIIAGSLAGGSCSGPGSVSGSGNLADDGTCDTVAFTGSASILLSAPGNYGGPTETIALLPGSAALNAGDPGSCPAKDQRGIGRPQLSGCDVGAFESRGFFIELNGGYNQSALVNKQFAAPLSVSVTAHYPPEPVDNGTIAFTAPASGASASLAGSPAKTTGGIASVTATANEFAGSYTVTANAAGANELSFSLKNTISSCELTVYPSQITKRLREAADDRIVASRFTPIKFIRASIPLQIFVFVSGDDTTFTWNDRPAWDSEGLKTLCKLRLTRHAMLALVFVNPFTAESGSHIVIIGDCAGSVELLDYKQE